ncbi:WecB/TagA/CpsF family glycosyltransferase [Anaerotalea alkaliphila]|uniref:N-acetylglucosaminyldiphosphoundecaprenol N-acetyl-beta-D-mannosaminyltransferase n=1 Tax=Anaerotalea alkaliphila TaxID=2662126 RepID=A0A7X5HVZ1_9FIRM|nr:WecB/TagA/CpsF family glycosyltransferase [Anaerotalea alkaliphila]NDL67657.1 WecB/TagA/CpsF family glycosyltransferase [Anaerotalea alkaliphila]
MATSKVNILGVRFQRGTMEQIVSRAMEFMEGQKTGTIYTPNPEIVMEAYGNPEVMAALNRGDLVIPDGIGVVLASRIIGEPLPERVAGFDTVQMLFAKMAEQGRTAYFLGAAPGVAKEAACRMEEKYPGLKVLGAEDGYFKEEESPARIERINACRPDLLLVGLGAPRQELWIDRHKSRLEVKLCAGVGGSFDVMAGTVKRAPDIFIRLGLEWFYRLLKQPSRWKRMMRLPLFLGLVFLKGRKYPQDSR